MAPLSIADIFGKPNNFNEHVADSFILFPCYANAAQDCITIPNGASCPNQPNANLKLANGDGNYEDQGVQSHEYFQLGGVVGQMYLATIHVDAISEAKYYENGTCDGSDTPSTCDQGRAAGLKDPPAAVTNTFVSCAAANPSQCNDTWYTGGNAVNAEHYNVYKITVYNPPAAGMPMNDAGGVVGSEVQHYYLNSFPQTATPYEQHSTYFLSYSHSFPVPGGGVLEYKTADQNCHAIDNCGPGYFTTTCAATGAGPRQLPNVTIPQTYMGNQVSVINARTGASQPYHSHVLHLTITDVKPM